LEPVQLGDGSISANCVAIMEKETSVSLIQTVRAAIFVVMTAVHTNVSHQKQNQVDLYRNNNVVPYCE